VGIPNGYRMPVAIGLTGSVLANLNSGDTMTQDDEDGIVSPKPHRAADLGRAAGRAVVGAIPGFGSAATELVNLLPDPTATRRKRWEQDVSEGVNDLNSRVAELDQRTGALHVTLTGGAAAAAMHMIRSCPDGRAQQWTSVDDLVAEFPDLTRDELLDGLGDLELNGLVGTISFIGSPPRYKLDESAYAALDPPILGWDPKEGAKVLAREALKSRGTVSVVKLEKALGWPRRRLNPALRIVVDFVGSGRVSQTIQPDYITQHFSPNNAERAALRAFSA
jgi:hypothetical protein